MKPTKYRDTFVPGITDLAGMGLAFVVLLYLAGICIGLGQYTVAWAVSHFPATAAGVPVDPE